MKCPACVAEGEKSRLFDEGGMVTLMAFTPWYDEFGVWHSHDGNRRTWSWRCSRGHRLIQEGRKPCPAGDFGGMGELKEFVRAH